MNVVELTTHTGGDRRSRRGRSSRRAGQVRRPVRQAQDAATHAWRGAGVATLTTGTTSVSAIVTAVSVPHAATGSHVIAFVAGHDDAMSAAAASPDCRASFEPGEDGPWEWVAGQPEILVDADDTDEPTAIVLCLLNATDESVPCEHNAAHDAAKICLAIRVDTLVARGSSRRWPALVG